MLREKERDLIQSYDESPYTNRKFNIEPIDKTKTPPKANRLHNDWWPTYDGQLSYNSHPTGVVKPVYGFPTFLLTAKAVLSQRHTFKKL